jgi:hypothetical protein
MERATTSEGQSERASESGTGCGKR